MTSAPPPPPPSAPPPPPPRPAADFEPVRLSSELGLRVEAVSAIAAPTWSGETVQVKRVVCPRCDQPIPHRDFSQHWTLHSSAVLPWLFLGGERNAKNLAEMKERTRISRVLNVSWEVANRWEGQFEYRRLDVKDATDQSIAEVLMEGITFIDEARRGRENVLVHCVQGISRSASVVVAYLMWYKRWSFKKAMEHVKMVRYCADPNEGFRKQLIQFEREIGVDELNAKDHEYHLDQEVQIVIDGIKHPDELPLFMEKED